MPVTSPLSVVFVLRRDQEILDVYGTDTAAFEAATRYRLDSRVVWNQSRPGRWWSALGALSVDPWTLKY